MTDMPEAPGRTIKKADVGWASAASSAITYLLITYTERLPENDALRHYLGSEVIALLSGAIVYLLVFFFGFLGFLLKRWMFFYEIKCNIKSIDTLILLSRCESRKAVLEIRREELISKASKIYSEF